MSKIEKAGKKGRKADKASKASEAGTALQAIEAIDVRATHEVARHRDAAPMRLAAFLGEVADQPQLITASVATIAAGMIGRRPDLVRGGARMLTAHLIATAAKTLIKHSFDRTRPEKAIADGRHRFEEGDSGDHELNSFPSGHTAGAVAVARAASHDIAGAALPATLGAGAIAALQPASGHHYLSDVVVGAAIGWISEAAASTLIDRIEPALARRWGIADDAR